MKPVIVAICLASLAVCVSAQDRLPRDETQRYARVCVEQAGDLGDAPLKMDVSTEKAVAVRGEGGGAMAIPNKDLTKEKLTRAGNDVVPVGQLWLRKWTVVAGGKAVPKDRLRVVTVNVDDKDRPMPLLLLGVRKGKTGLVMVAYARDSEPVLVVPLKKVDFVQDVPLDLQWERGEKNVDPLTFTFFGKYQAALAITRQ